MYCLDCGKKIDDGQNYCPQCGSSVSEMEERLAQAEEMLIYAETVGPSQTAKLPPVKERTYQDRLGNPLDPAEEVDLERHRSREVLEDLPRIGSEDPYVTMPMKRIVNDQAQVVHDSDSDAKAYVQPPVKQRSWLPVKLAAGSLAAIALIAGCVFVAPSVVASLSSSGQAEDSSAAEQSVASVQMTDEERGQRAYEALLADYDRLPVFQERVESAVDDFEGYYAVTNRQTRQLHSDSCAALNAELVQTRDGLIQRFQELGIDASNPYQTQLDRVVGLYDCLITRTSVISQCWDRSLSYDSPKSKTSAILAPLTADLKNGKSASMATFKENLEAGKPQLLS